MPEGIRNDAKKYGKNKRVVILEGTIDYSPYAVQLMNDLCNYLPNDFKIELYGNFEDKREQLKLNSDINYKGFLNRSDVNQVLSNSIYISLDINPA
ncbi:hypothetical protein K8354_09630 [Polaribacter litorisediminis]|uniref:hypothetical protein n=1 Tax=Polaribacter litorisediminis TaxID=1908341 RepID=UPI001CBA9E43|nr:hypothetical protein [Polaribacter litorisediminis]UAM96602.1 hypothetical protein K8354_09630 [Polaribacter litorisediminis]